MIDLTIAASDEWFVERKSAARSSKTFNFRGSTSNVHPELAFSVENVLLNSVNQACKQSGPLMLASSSRCTSMWHSRCIIASYITIYACGPAASHSLGKMRILNHSLYMCMPSLTHSGQALDRPLDPHKAAAIRQQSATLAVPQLMPTWA